MQILAWVSIRFFEKIALLWRREKYAKTVPVHIFTVSPTLGVKK